MYTESLNSQENPTLLTEGNTLDVKLKDLDRHFRQDQFCYLLWLYTLLIISILISITYSLGFIDQNRNKITYESTYPVIILISFISQIIFQVWAIHKKALGASMISLIIMIINAILVSGGTLYYVYEVVNRIRNPLPPSEAASMGMRMSIFFITTGVLLLGVQIGINIRGAINARKTLSQRENLKKSIRKSLESLEGIVAS